MGRDGALCQNVCISSGDKRIRPGVEIVFFTTNYVLHPVYSEGMTCYHLPSRKKFEGMEARTWNQQCEDILANVFSVHNLLFLFLMVPIHTAEC